MRKTLLSLAAAALALASASASADFIPFTVNEGVVAGAVAHSFEAGKLTGQYSELLAFTGPGTFSASAVGILGGYGQTDGSSIGSQLVQSSPFAGSNQYGIYAVFTASGAATSSTTFIGTSGSLKLYLDPNADTTFSAVNGAGFNNPNAFATASSGASDDILIGSSTIGYGTGDLTAAPGAFNIFFEQFTLTAFGATYWTGIDTLQFRLQTNGDVDQITKLDPSGNPLKLTGDFSANFALPEPGSIMLVGAGLLGLGFASRRRQSK